MYNNTKFLCIYHKGNIELILRDLAAFANTFLSCDPQPRSIEQLWKEFEQAVHQAVTDHVPHKDSLPWINP